MEPFKASYRKAFNGLSLAIIQSKGIAGNISLEASSKGIAISNNCFPIKIRKCVAVSAAIGN
jgi:beta-galactosidase